MNCNTTHYRANSSSVPGDPTGFREHSPLHHIISGRRTPGPESVVERKFVDGRRLLFLAQYVRNKDLTAEDIRRHRNFGMLSETVGAMKRLADGRRLRVAVVLVPSKEEVYSWVLEGSPAWSTTGAASGFSAEVARLSREHGMPFLDLKPELVAASRQVYEGAGQLLWWGDDTHWNTLAQRIAAAAVNRELLRPPQ